MLDNAPGIVVKVNRYVEGGRTPEALTALLRDLANTDARELEEKLRLVRGKSGR